MNVALRKTETETEEYWLAGFCLALGLHLTIFFFIFYRPHSIPAEFARPIVYSVSIEGGKTLGGRTQVPQTDKPTPLAPPKNVSTPPETKPKEVAKADPKEDPKVKVVDAEVSLATKKPAPTPKPLPTPKVDPKKVVNDKLGVKQPKPTPVKKAEVVDPDKEYQRAMQRYLGESADAGGKGFGAALQGGKGMGGGVLASPEFIAYLNLLKSHVHRGWRWNDHASGYRARVYFRIEPDGAIKDVRMVDGSGSREFDDSVLRALAKADPVPPPPEKVYSAFKEVRMVFDPQELE